MRTKHVHRLVRVFATPLPASLGWDEVEAMLLACGKELDLGAVASLRAFLEHAGVTP